MQEYQWIANFGFAAVIAWYALTTLNATIKDSAIKHEKAIASMTRQLKLNSIILARISGQDFYQIEKDFDANGNGNGGC